MLSIGSRTYNLTDFSQELKRCPSCNSDGIFVSSYVHFFQLNSIPIYPKNPFATAVCRNCKEQFKPGNSGPVDVYINDATSDMEVPKYLYAGALLYPLAIGSAFAFFASFK